VPDLTKKVGSLPLGLTIADDIFAAGDGLAPKASFFFFSFHHKT